MPIINDVEVEGCKYFLNNEHKTCGEGLVDCDGKDCLYKQLKRLEKENEELKEEIRNYKMYGCSDTIQPNAYVVDSAYQGAIIGKEIYRKALEKIREMTKSVRYFPQERFELIKDVINKVLESEGERTITNTLNKN